MAAMGFQAMAEEPSIFRDPEDGELDASAWLLDKKGFLPVPIIVTEPAIGYGGGAALLWFRESLGERRAQGRSFSDGDTVSAWGVGLRRLVARRLGIYMGADLARGPEETANYIQAGSAWR